MADTPHHTLDSGVVGMEELTRRAEVLLKAYEQICEANKTIMANCTKDCRNCPIQKICDNEWIIYDESEFKQVEPWADLINKADKEEPAEEDDTYYNEWMKGAWDD